MRLAAALLLTSGVLVAQSALPQVITPSKADERVIFEPDLRVGLAGSDARCRVVHGDGGMIIANISTARVSCTQLLDPSRDFQPPFRLEATLRRRQGPTGDPIGVFFGDRKNTQRATYAAFTYTDTAARLETFDGTQWTSVPPQTPGPAPRTSIGASNKLTVEVRGRDVRALLNGTLFATTKASLPLDGRAGIFVNASGQEVVVSEFRVTALSPAAAIAPQLPPPNAPPQSGAPMTPARLTVGGKVLVDHDLTTDPGFGSSSGPLCTSAYRDGGLVLEGPTGCEWPLGEMTERPLRTRFEVSARVLTGDSAGLVIGQTSRPDHLHYHVIVSVTGMLTVEMIQSKQVRALGSWNSSAIRTSTGATNRIAVEVHGQELRCFVNTQFVGRVTSPEIVQGNYGLIVNGTGGRAVFSNLRIVEF